ncbi:unnamed protein product [Adineta steineri]|uniref:RING-type domain-containing protein n=1 Tax=Adineta steineri TaxID=433720 RepID=A0A818SXU7_9BILA|nr:unnamed protein product [Adineta steineri]CAF3672146.1 unnamed protein product [Adineta steineri]
MNSSAIYMSVDGTENLCEICFDEVPINMDVITCAHQNTFCKKCIKTWFDYGNVTCPKCRALWSVNIDSENIDVSEVNLDELRTNMNIIRDAYRETPWPVNIYREYIDLCSVCSYEEPTNTGVITCGHRNIFCTNCIKTWLGRGNVTCPICHAPWAVNIIATGSSTNNVLTCCAVGLLIGILIYRIIK